MALPCRLLPPGLLLVSWIIGCGRPKNQYQSGPPPGKRFFSYSLALWFAVHPTKYKTGPPRLRSFRYLNLLSEGSALSGLLDDTFSLLECSRERAQRSLLISLHLKRGRLGGG